MSNASVSKVLNATLFHLLPTASPMYDRLLFKIKKIKYATGSIVRQIADAAIGNQSGNPMTTPKKPRKT